MCVMCLLLPPTLRHSMVLACAVVLAAVAIVDGFDDANTPSVARLATAFTSLGEKIGILRA